MPQWQQIVGDGWVQFADLRLSDACFRYTQQLCNAPAPSGLAAQKQRVADIWTWMGNGLRALDVPPAISPQYRSAFRRAFGSIGYDTTDGATDGGYWTDGSNPPDGSPGSGTEGRSVFGRNCQDLFDGQRPGGGLSIFRIRYLLREQNSSLTSHDAGTLLDETAVPPGMGDPYWIDSPEGRRQTFGGETDWMNWGFWDGGPFAWLAATNVGKVLPPIEWFIAPAKEAIDQFVALGALEVLTEARYNAVLLNMKMALKHHLVSNAALLAAAAAVPADLYGAAWTDQTQSSKVAAKGIITVGSAILAEGVHEADPEMVAVGAIISAAGLAIQLAPSAVGPANSDMFGRAEPVFESGSISGGAGNATSSFRLNVPNPPGYVPPHYVPVIGGVFLPGVGGSDACVAPIEFVSEASRQEWISAHPHCDQPPPFTPSVPDKSSLGMFAVGALFLGALWKIFSK